MNIVDALVLKNLKGVGEISINKLLEFASGNNISSLEELAKLSIQTLPLKKVPTSLKEFLEDAEFEVARLIVQDEMRNWSDQGITAICRNSEQYPKPLLGLEDPPPFLYCKGNLALLQKFKAIAVVGTRENTSLGAEIASRTTKVFSEAGFVIVSGLALGIDAIAHKAAIESGGSTIAVLVDIQKVVPEKNRILADSILKNNGLWIAENPPGTNVFPALFAKRDRIQSGLSTAVFAIETSKTGGTMHAVRAAVKMGRPVFVPDPVAARYNDLNLEVIQGTQFLISDGLARSYTGGSYKLISQELEALALKMEKSRDLSQGGVLL